MPGVTSHPRRGPRSPRRIFIAMWGDGLATYRYLCGLAFGALAGYAADWSFLAAMALIPAGLTMVAVAMRRADRGPPPAAGSPACLDGHPHTRPCAQAARPRRTP